MSDENSLQLKGPEVLSTQDMSSVAKIEVSIAKESSGDTSAVGQLHGETSGNQSIQLPDSLCFPH